MASTKLATAAKAAPAPAAKPPKVVAPTAKVKTATTRTEEPIKGLPEGGKRAANRAQKIKLLVKENPGREGSKRHAWYELYKTCKTVGDYLDAGGDAGYLRRDQKEERISIGWAHQPPR